MSDNIDYAELDKAVNEQIRNRSTAAPVAKKPVTKRPRGQFMDFVRTQPLPTPKAVNTVKPAVKPVAKTAPRPATKPVAPVAAKPVARKVTTAPRPAIAPRSVKPVRPTVAQPALRPAAHPAVTTTRTSVAAQIQQRQQRATAPVVKPAAKSAPKPAQKPAAKPATVNPRPASAKPTPAAKPAAQAKKDAPKTPEAPNANNYSLGVRSPFLTNTKVEKRPLGADVPETSTHALRSTRNVYSSKSPSKVTTNTKKHIITEAPKDHSGWIWTLIVLFVIAAGAGLGYLAYRLVFAN